MYTGSVRARMGVLITAAVIVLTACSSSPGSSSAGNSGGTGAALPSAASSGNLEIFSYWTAGGEAQALAAVEKVFSQQYPNIKITNAVVAGGAGSNANAVLAQRMQANDPPDTFQIHGGAELLDNWVKTNYMQPLTDLYQQQGWMDKFPKQLIDLVSYNGAPYAVPLDVHRNGVLWYNKSIFTQNNLQPPTTWDDFMKICQAVSKPPTTYCYELNTDASRFAGWVFSRGGDLLSADGKSVAFNSQAGLDSLNFMNELFRNNYATVIGKAFQDQTDFSLGKIAFTFGSTAGLPYYMQSIQQAGKVKNWGIAPEPHTTPQPVEDVYGPSVTIFKTTTAKERAAFVFLKWLMDSGPNATWVEATDYFPARQSMRAQLTDFIQKNPLYGQALDWLQYGRTEPNIAAWNPIRNYIADALTAVANGTSTPQQALDKAASQANATLQGAHY